MRRRPSRLSVPRIGALLALALLESSLAPALDAQQSPGAVFGGGEELVDRVVAVVGDSVVLASQVRQRLNQLGAQGVEIPDDPAQRAVLERDVLETLVNEQLIVQAALADTTIALNQSRIDEMVSSDLRERAQQFGGDAAMRQALREEGLTMGAFREMLRTEARRQQLQNQFLSRRQQAASTLTVSEREMREFFDENRARFGQRPASVTFEQVVLRPSASDSARAEARREAERILEILRSGESEFEELARQRSDDPGTRDQGGALGWFRRGDMVRAFEDVVFSLREGRISDVVETRFGFHIIRVDRVRGAERRARHILITPDVTDSDVDALRIRAEDVKRRLEEGASMDSLQAALATTDEDPDSLNVPLDDLGRLPPGYEGALRDARPGEVVGPIEWGPPDQRNVAVVRVTDRREAGEVTFEEVRPQIRQRLQQEKLLERLFAELREQTYVEIRI